MPGVVRSPSQRARSGQKALLKGREWWGGPPGGPGVVESLPEHREWSEGTLEGPGVVKRPSWWAGSGWEDFPKGQEWLGMVEGTSCRARSGREALP